MSDETTKISAETWQERKKRRYTELSGREPAAVYQGTFTQMAEDYAMQTMMDEIHLMLRTIVNSPEGQGNNAPDRT